MKDNQGYSKKDVRVRDRRAYNKAYRDKHKRNKSYPDPLNCKNCKNLFVPHNARQTFCSARCVDLFWSKGADEESNLCTGTRGAIHELAVSIDLMRKGWHVFRAISPACPVDLIAMRDGVIYRVQVKKGRLTKAGGLSQPSLLNPNSDFDIMAISTLHDGIKYFPDAPA